MRIIIMMLAAVSLVRGAAPSVPFLFETIEKARLSYHYRPVMGSYDTDGTYARYPARLIRHYHDMRADWVQQTGPVHLMLGGSLAGISVPSDILNRVDFGGGDMRAGLLWRPRPTVWTAGQATIPTGSYRLGLGGGVWRFGLVTGARFRKRFSLEVNTAFSGPDPDGDTPGAELSLRGRYQGLGQPVLGILWQGPEHRASGDAGPYAWRLRLELFETVTLRRGIRLFTHGYADLAGRNTDRAIGVGLGLYK